MPLAPPLKEIALFLVFNKSCASLIEIGDALCWYKADIDLYNSNCRPINFGNDYDNSTCSS